MQAHGSNANRDTYYDGITTGPSEAVQFEKPDSMFRSQT